MRCRQEPPETRGGVGVEPRKEGQLAWNGGGNCGKCGESRKFELEKNMGSIKGEEGDSSTTLRKRR